jgi:FkbM family methyltransferase
MSLIKNIAAFKNWYMFYADRCGLLHNEFQLRLRNGLEIRLRPNTDDLKIVKSNVVTRHYMRDFLPITKDSIVVDVGAHIGCFSIIAARNAYKVLAFEPEPKNYRMLKENVRLNNLKNISIFEMAVSGSHGYQDIAIYVNGSTGSHSLYHGNGRDITKKRVQTISLEEIIRKEALPRIDFLKLDCEGAEHDILKNMGAETASRIMGIAMETHGRHESSIDIPVRLKELGFEVKVESNGGYIYGRQTCLR